MSATLSTPNPVRSPADVIWSRGGGSFQRLVWKELCEHFVFWMVLFWVTFLLAVGFPPTQRESLSAIWLHAAPSLFALGFGALAFAREFESGTWDLLRAIGVSSRDVWRSKLLVGGVGSLVLSMQGVLLSLTWRKPFFIGQFGLTTVAFLEVTLLTLLASMLISLHTRRVLTAIVVSAGVLLPVWNLWIETVEYYEFLELATPSSWQLTYGLVLVAVAVLIVGLWLWQVSLVRRRLNCSVELIDSRRWWSVFRRMVWKESRMALDFWLAVVVITAVFAGLGRLSLTDLATRNQVIATLGIIFPVLHSLGCGGIAFAIEREDTTQDWLRRMAAPARSLFAAKLLVTQASILSLTSLLLFGTHCLVTAEGRMSAGAIAWVVMLVSLNGAISLAASQGTRRVLPAVFLAFVLSGIVDVLLMNLFGSFLWLRPGHLNAIAFVPMWFLLMGLAVLIGLWQSDRWLNERPWWQWRRRTEPLKTNTHNRALFEQSPIPDRRAFGRLLWREWMEAKVWLWALPLTIAPALTAELGRVVPGRAPSAMLFLAFATSGIATLMLIVTPTLLGVWSFHHDRRHELLRFLSHRGGSPSSIWWSKQAVWLTLLAAGTSLAVSLYAMQLQYNDIRWRLNFAALALICVVQSFAAGQWVSQLVRSPLNAMFLAAVLSMLLAGWTNVLNHVRVALLWHLVAPAIFFVASRLRARDWLEERWSWRAWTRTLLSVVLPALATWLILESLSYPISRTIRDWMLPR